MHILLITGFLRPLNLGSFYSLILRVQSSNQQLLTLRQHPVSPFWFWSISSLPWLDSPNSVFSEGDNFWTISDRIFTPYNTKLYFHTLFERLKKSRFFVELFSTEQLETSVRSRGYEKWSITVVFFRFFQAFLQTYHVTKNKFSYFRMSVKPLETMNSRIDDTTLNTCGNLVSRSAESSF